tara:strand:+ start:553 stop:819 length:267 start_codon:yes stop_codon:yes gene_type:complete
MKENDKQQKHFQEMLFCKKCKHKHDAGGIMITPCSDHRDDNVIHLVDSNFDKATCGFRGKAIHVTDDPSEITCLDCQMKLVNKYMVIP